MKVCFQVTFGAVYPNDVNLGQVLRQKKTCYGSIELKFKEHEA